MTTPLQPHTLRWDPYLMHQGNSFISYWSEYLRPMNRNLLYILGAGFDPRMCDGLAFVLNAGGTGCCNCILIEFDEGKDSSSQQYADLVHSNKQKLLDLLGDSELLKVRNLQTWLDESQGQRRRRISSRSALDIFSEIEEFNNFTDIIIDISALPRGIFFPMIGRILTILDSAKARDHQNRIPNFYVVIAENPQLDKHIKVVGIDESADYISGFGTVELESNEELPKIWIPVLGEGQSSQLERIYARVIPDEICPLFPSPSLNPRRADDLLLEYHELLFDRWRIEPTNIIYASEHNPFEVYRQIRQTVHQYNRALTTLGGCRAIISATASKLLSIGALLAAYELKKEGQIIGGVAHVETQGYSIEKLDNGHTVPVLLCLAGECYDD